MSYDYNALVSDIHRSCRQALDANDGETQAHRFAEALETFQTLSGHCPMTPLLWIQHAAAASRLIELTGDGAATPPEHEQAALRTRLDILELGLQEFPGSALLHLCRAEFILAQSHETVPVPDRRLMIESSLQRIGQGSHLNEDVLIHRLYQIHLRLCLEEGDMDLVQQSLVARSLVPLQANQSLEQEARDLLTERVDESQAATTLAAIERGRRQVARTYGELYTYGEDIDMQMQRLGIAVHQALPTTQYDHGDNFIDWARIAEPRDQHFGMGLGDKTVAHAFIEYALAIAKRVHHACSEPNEGHSDEDENGGTNSVLPENLPVSVYERAVAECPTVESLWLSYIRHLNERLAGVDGLSDDRTKSTASALYSVVGRAVRNCPESLQLLGQRLQFSLVLSNLNLQVLDPDALMATVNEALSNKFLPADWQFLEAHLMAIRVVKQRIMTLITPANIPGNGKDYPAGYDDAESVPKTRKKHSTSSAKTTLPQEAVDEVSDLIDDLDEMYEEVESRLQASFKTWTVGRSLLWRERGLTSQWLLNDLKKIRSKKVGSIEGDPEPTALSCLEKALRFHNPPHPDSYRSYISVFISDISLSTMTTEPDVLQRIRRVRYLYQQAIANVARGKPDNESSGERFDEISQRDFDAAFASLSHDWLEFERVLGSDRSLGRAKRAIQNKLRRTQPAGKRQYSVHEDPGMKIVDAIDHVLEGDGRLSKKDLAVEEEPPNKKLKIGSDVKSDNLDAPLDVKRDGTANENSQKLKVKVGQMEYPVHPYTVRISYLDVATEDMDLVQLLQPKCGNVVHARIVRDRVSPYKSKGWALVQFEEKDSAEKALALNDVISLHEKVLRIERSHLPAVSLVPAGRHRIHEKGQGKYSKRNQKKLQQKLPTTTCQEEMQASADKVIKTDSGPHVTSDSTGAHESTNSNPLLLRPRKIARQAHQKSRITIEN